MTFFIRDAAAAAAAGVGFSQTVIGVVSLSLSSSPGCYDVVDSVREKEANLLSIIISVIRLSRVQVVLVCNCDGVSLSAIENSQADLLSIIISVLGVEWRLCIIDNTRCAAMI